MIGVAHYNAALPHQYAHAEAFKACGFGVSSSPDSEADIHVISGPHFALNKWKHHPRVLMIDRAWWGDPDCVSIGWLQPDGTRKFAASDKPRPKPDYLPWKTRECSCIILADYGQDIDELKSQLTGRFTTVQVRQHPADGEVQQDIDSAVMLRDVAYGNKGTSVFNAVMAGTPSMCHPDNECAAVCSTDIDEPLYRGDRDEWLHDMSYKQWSLAEIASGEAWQHLKDIQ